MDDIEQRLRKLIDAHFSLNGKEIQLEQKFIEDLGADSLDVVEVVMNVEEEFDIQLDDDESEAITTVGEALAAIRKKTA